MAALAGAAGFAQRARRRVIAQDARAFERFAQVLVLAMFLNIASGAFVRLTGSGLGCPDWPLCKGQPVPPLQLPPGDRVLEPRDRAGGHPGRAADLPLGAARRPIAPRAGSSGGVALLTFGQIPLGAVTVLFDLNPLLVMSHFLVAVDGDGPRRGAARAAVRPAPRRRFRAALAWLARASVVAAFALIVSGTFSTAAGPHAGGAGHPPHGQPARRDLRPRARRDDLRRRRGAAAARAAVRRRGGPTAGGASRSR